MILISESYRHVSSVIRLNATIQMTTHMIFAGLGVILRLHESGRTTVMYLFTEIANNASSDIQNIEISEPYSTPQSDKKNCH